jgi:hypothetical protein
MSIKEKYQKIEKTLKLPSFDSLNNDFEISLIEEEDFFLREIRRKMTERIEAYVKLVEPVLQPEAIVCDMHECKELSEDEKSKIFEVYKKLMFLHRYSAEISIDEDDKKTSLFINEVMKDWPAVKKQLAAILKKLKESWLADTELKEDLAYMG